MLNQIIGTYLYPSQRQSFLDLGSLEDRIELAARTLLDFQKFFDVMDKILAEFIAQVESIYKTEGRQYLRN